MKFSSCFFAHMPARLVAQVMKTGTESLTCSVYLGPRSFRRLRKGIVLPIIQATALACLRAATEPSSAQAPAAVEKSDADLMSIDLDALSNTKVTSASKREEKLSDVATALTVISNDDLRRSGATSVAQALRLVPGMDVAQVNSSTWAISARGFDEIYSRSLLVLVDGRTVFGPFAGGVFWDLQQQMLDDLDRVEVIRGPGGTLWGANAVNGVINIVSKSARDTQGTLLYGSVGNSDETTGGARYGGKLNDSTYYRVFGSYQKTTSFKADDGSSVGTGYQGESFGFRIDHYGAADATQGTLQAGMTYNDLLDRTARDYNANILGRWTRTFSDASSFEFQTYVDRTVNNSWGGIDLAVNTFDLTAQHNLNLGQRNDVVWGVGYRLWEVNLTALTTPSLVLQPHFSEQRANIFGQYTFKAIPDKLTLTVGAKVEYNTITSVEFEPNVRVMFKPTDKQTVWGAISRTVLVPTLKAGHNGYRQPDNIGPVDTYDFGNPNIKSAPVWSYELGYRIQPTKRVSLDIATYYSRYSQLQNQVQTGTVYTWENAFEAETYGGEASLTIQPADTVRLTAFYAVMKIREWGPVPDTDVLGGSPQRQAGFRFSADLAKRVGLDAQMRYVDRVAGADAYVTGDFRLSYRPTEKIELALVGQNLFQTKHVELGAGQFGDVARNVYGKITWKF